MDFTDKVCVVTGGANGIGRCIVEEFHRAGAFVAFIDTDKVLAKKVISKMDPCRILFHHGDLSDEQVIISFVKEIVSRFHHVDYLVNNACVSRKGILSKCSFEDFNYVLKLGVIAPYMLTKLLLNSFTPNAAIVNISSTRASMSQPDTESYTAAKGGIRSLTHALAVSLAGKVRVNSISPGWIDTGAYQHEEEYIPHYSTADWKQHLTGRVGTPMDIAKMVLFLCSNDASFITGEDITIDGGMTKQMIYSGDFGWTLR